MAKTTTKTEKNYLATECDVVGETAIHYGFTVVTPPHISTADTTDAKQFKNFDYYEDAAEKIALTKWYTEHLQNGPQPAMVTYKKSAGTYGLEIIGTTKPESEALMLKTTLGILCDLGYTDVCVDVNSIGDRESISRFERELGAYYRKHGTGLPKKVREEWKKNPYTVLTQISADTTEFMHAVPQTMGCLSDLSRSHFKEVLEYMEVFGIQYKVKSNLFANKLYASHTVFEIRDISKISGTTSSGDSGTLLAYGYRYNYLAKKIGAKKEIPSISMTIVVKKGDVPAKKIIIKNIKKPKFYLVQLGETAKLKALNVVEMLRTERIPVYHSLTKDKITGQLSGAEYVKATHVLIIGQKEAIENSIVVRHVVTREQETVALHELANFLRKLG